MSGINISKALLSAGGKVVDVTSNVMSKIKDGILQVNASPAALNVDDPNPGQPKTLDLTYTINNGKPTTAHATETSSFGINAPSARQADGLNISKVEYGTDLKNMQDVTSAVQGLVKDGTLHIKKLDHKTIGLPDPDPTKPKKLHIEYTINGGQNSGDYTDGDEINIEAPPFGGSDKRKAKDVLLSFITMAFGNVIWFVWSLVYFACAFGLWEMRRNITGSDSYLWGIIALMGPLASFVVLPFLFFWRILIIALMCYLGIGDVGSEQTAWEIKFPNSTTEVPIAPVTPVM